MPSGVSVGIQRDPAALVDAVGAYLDEGYVRIKIKIKPGRDIDDTSAVRDAFGAIPLQVDANSAYTLQDADTLAELDRFDLLLIEQPLQEDDLVDHATLATRLRTPVCLDESIVSDKAAADALALGSAAIINIKAGRVGGYLEAVAIHDRAVAAGVPVWCGGMLETGIGRAANAALAALPGFTLPGDISASARFYTRDIVTEPAVIEDGHVRVPTGPGLGVEIDDGGARGVHRAPRADHPMSGARSGLSETDRDDVPWGRAPVDGIPIPPFTDAAEHRTYLRALQTFLLLLDQGEPSAATIALAAALEAELTQAPREAPTRLSPLALRVSLSTFFPPRGRPRRSLRR